MASYGCKHWSASDSHHDVTWFHFTPFCWWILCTCVTTWLLDQISRPVVFFIDALRPSYYSIVKTSKFWLYSNFSDFVMDRQEVVITYTPWACFLTSSSRLRGIHCFIDHHENFTAFYKNTPKTYAIFSRAGKLFIFHFFFVFFLCATRSFEHDFLFFSQHLFWPFDHKICFHALCLEKLKDLLTRLKISFSHPWQDQNFFSGRNAKVKRNVTRKGTEFLISR